MKVNSGHILVSHVGRLPDPRRLEELQRSGAPDVEIVAELPDAVKSTVAEQLEHGIDIVNDGDLGKFGEGLATWTSYVQGRLTGFERKELPAGQSAPSGVMGGREQRQFPHYFAERSGGVPSRASGAAVATICTGPVTYVGQAEIARDIANLHAALEGRSVNDAFMTAVSPDNTNYHAGANEYYANEDEFLAAKAAAMRVEYQAIVDAGFVVQIDMPVMKYNTLSLTLEEFRRRFATFVEIMNHSLAGLPPERIRVHICYGGGRHPHTGDLNLNDFIDLVLKLNVATISYDQNARHEHEWAIFEDVKLPEGKVLMPGVASHVSDVVEHPELVAQRLVRLANLVGREHVIAGTDCGLGRRVPHEVVWAKFDSMAEGARIASKKLWR